MEGWIKQDVGPKGEVCEFHTITLASINFSKLPDQNGAGGASSVIRLSTFVSRQFYNDNRGDASLAVKHRNYIIPLTDIAPLVRLPDGDTSVEQKAYEIILSKDTWFQNATPV